MTLPLINGLFSPQDALDILTNLTQVKVNYHENQIKTSDREEDIKLREKRIKELQKSLQEVRQAIAQNSQRGVNLQADIQLVIR